MSSLQPDLLVHTSFKQKVSVSVLWGRNSLYKWCYSAACWVNLGHCDSWSKTEARPLICGCFLSSDISFPDCHLGVRFLRCAKPKMLLNHRTATTKHHSLATHLFFSLGNKNIQDNCINLNVIHSSKKLNV